MKKLFWVTVFWAGTLFPQQWEIIGDMPYPVAGAEAIVNNNKIYILGGYSDSLQANVDWIQEYDLNFNSWVVNSRMLKSRTGFGAALYEASIYYAGGVHDNSPGSHTLGNWIIGGTADSVSHDPNFNRIYTAGVSLGPRLFFIGGNKYEGSDTNNISYIIEFDMENRVIINQEDTIYRTSELPEQQSAVIVWDTIYIFGGVYNGVSPRIFKYDLLNRTHTRAAFDLTTPRAGARAVYNAEENKVFIIGGFNETSRALSSMDVLNLDYNYVIEGTHLNIARSKFSVAIVDNNIYVFGGYDENGNIIKEIELLSRPVTGIEQRTQVPSSNRLYDNYPNPFNPSTEIMFELREENLVHLDVYSVLGEHIARIADGVFPSGKNKVSWNGKDGSGNEAPAGIYIYRFNSGSYTESKKMLLLK